MALLNLQQQLDLINNEIQDLWHVATTACDQRFTATLLCDTTKPANLSSARLLLHEWILGPYNSTYFNLSIQLTEQIQTINSIQVPILTDNVLSDLLHNLRLLFSPANLLTFGFFGLLGLLILIALHILCTLLQLITSKQAMMASIQLAFTKKEGEFVGKRGPEVWVTAAAERRVWANSDSSANRVKAPPRLSRSDLLLPHNPRRKVPSPNYAPDPPPLPRL